MNDKTTEPFERLTNEIKGIEQKIIPLLDTQSEEIAKHGETAAATSKALKALEEKYDERMRDFDALREEFGEVKSDIGTLTLPAGRKQRETPGSLFTNSEEYKTLNGEVTQPVNVKSFFQGRKDLFTDAPVGSVDVHLYEGRRLPGVIEDPAPDMHIRDLLPVTPIAEGLVYYVERSGGRWVAQPQREEVDEEIITEGALKHEQALAFQAKSAGPVTIAHWLPISKQALRRAPQLRQYIDTELITGVRLAEDAQLLYGDGSAGNLQGLMTNPLVQDYDAASRRQAGDTRIDTIRRAITLLRLMYYRASGLVLHPNDWEEIELQKDDESRYLWVTVTEGGAPRLWRVPVIDTPTIEEDEFLLGDFRIGANLWDLETANVTTGWVNDGFVRNQLAILGEEDVIFTTEHPKAFVKGVFEEPEE